MDYFAKRQSLYIKNIPKFTQVHEPRRKRVKSNEE
jgi:hypothetical protein